MDSNSYERKPMQAKESDIGRPVCVTVAVSCTQY